MVVVFLGTRRCVLVGREHRFCSEIRGNQMVLVEEIFSIRLLADYVATKTAGRTPEHIVLAS